MTVEVQLEALAQHLFVDLADAALPGRAGVRHRDVDAAEGLDDSGERPAQRRGIGDVAPQRERGRADGLGLVPGCVLVEIEQGDLGARRGKRSAVAAPIVPPAPVMTATWPASGFSAARPSLACSSDQYSMSNICASEIDLKRPIASASVMAATAHSARSAAMPASLLSGRGRTDQGRERVRRGAGIERCLMPPTRAF